MKMKLYHGTSSKWLGRILNSGIQPRKNRTGNWVVPANRKLVYLSSLYPFYYAMQATDTERYQMVVIEVDTENLPEENFYPDEDLIWHVLHQQGKDVTLEQCQPLIWDNQHLWKECLRLMGTVAYLGTIGVEHITRILTVDIEKMETSARLYFYGLGDKAVAPILVELRKTWFEAELAWLFGDQPDPPLNDLKLIDPQAAERTIPMLNKAKQEHTIVRTLRKE